MSYQRGVHQVEQRPHAARMAPEGSRLEEEEGWETRKQDDNRQRRRS